MTSEWELVPHTTEAADSIFSYSEGFPNDLAQRRDYLGSLEANDALNLVQYINGLIRGSDGPYPFDREPGRYEFDTGSLNEAAVPDARDADTLLAESWGVASRFLHDISIEDRSALQLAGITLANSVLLVHPYLDANGRTSRIVSYMTAAESVNIDDIQVIVSEHHGQRRWLVQPQFVQKTVPRTGSLQPKHIQTNWEFDQENHLPWAISYSPRAVKEGVIRILLEDPVIESTPLARQADEQKANFDGAAAIDALLNGNDVAEYIAGLRTLFNAYRQARAEVVGMFLNDMADNTARMNGMDFRQCQLWALRSLSSALQ